MGMLSRTNRTTTRQVRYTVSVTPSDSEDLPHGATRALYVGETGDVEVVYENGMEDTLPNLQGGGFYPLMVVRVKASGTTATGLKAAY